MHVKFQSDWKSKPESRGFETSRDLVIKCPSAKWIKSQMQTLWCEQYVRYNTWHSVYVLRFFVNWEFTKTTDVQVPPMWDFHIRFNKFWLFRLKFTSVTSTNKSEPNQSASQGEAWWKLQNSTCAAMLCQRPQTDPWPLLLTWINFNPTWISNHMPSKVRDGITYPFLNFNGCILKFRNG